jgi:hypothetical protein
LRDCSGDSATAPLGVSASVLFWLSDFTGSLF